MSVTTGSISGLVTDQDGEGLPGAVITALHEPTGTRYTTVTRADGQFRIFDVRVGGPYEISASMTGFKTATQADLFVKLGENLRLEFTLQLDSIEETL